MNKTKVLTTLAVTVIVGHSMTSLLLYGQVSKRKEATASQLMVAGYVFDPLNYHTVAFVDPLAQAIAQTKQAAITETTTVPATISAETTKVSVNSQQKSTQNPWWVADMQAGIARDTAQQAILKSRFLSCDLTVWHPHIVLNGFDWYQVDKKATVLRYRAALQDWAGCPDMAEKWRQNTNIFFSVYGYHPDFEQNLEYFISRV